MEKILFVNAEKCVGCRTCEMVCSLSHTDEVNPVRSRIKVVKWEDKAHAIPMNCRHCENAPCEEICPKQAISHTDQGYGVMIDLDKCIGCRSCLMVCPFGAIRFDAIDRTVVKCDLCESDPMCVKFCAYDAVQLIDADVLNKDQLMSATAKLYSLQFDSGACEPLGQEMGTEDSNGS